MSFPQAFPRRDGVLLAGEASLEILAARYGTPAYIYNATAIRERATRLAETLKSALGRAPLLAFACKANSSLAILDLLRQAGCGADIVSGGELARARRAGIAAGNIVFSGVGKTDAEIIDALRTGVRQLNIESAPEIDRIAALASGLGVVAPICIRVNPDVDAGTHGKISTGRRGDKFGLPPAEALILYERVAADQHLRPRGLSVHIGSQLLDLTPFRAGFSGLVDLAMEVRRRGLPLDTLDLGGGLGVDYHGDASPDPAAYAAMVAEIAGPLQTDIIFEPGRWLVAEAGIVLSRVVHIKESEGKRHVILDAGMNDLLRPALYDAWHPIWPVGATVGPEGPCDVVGPVCETSDLFAADRLLPPLKSGDLVAIGCAGAYGFSMASTYNSRLLPPEILVDGARHALIRTRQTMNELLAGERLPDWATLA